MSDSSKESNDESLRREMENIIRAAGIESMSIKTLIKELSDRMGIDMKCKKKYIKEILPEILEKISSNSDKIQHEMENTVHTDTSKEPSDESLRREIEKITRADDIESMSIKTLIKDLSDRMGIDMQYKKKYIKEILPEILEKISSNSDKIQHEIENTVHTDTSKEHSDESLRREMEYIIRADDTESMSTEKLIKDLSDRMGIDMQYKKDYINLILPDILAKISREDEYSEKIQQEIENIVHTYTSKEPSDESLRREMEYIIRSSDTKSMPIEILIRELSKRIGIDMKYKKKYINLILPDILAKVSSEDDKEHSKRKLDETVKKSTGGRGYPKVSRTDSYKSLRNFLNRDQMMQDSLNDVDHILSLGYQIILDRDRLRAYIDNNEIREGQSRHSTAAQQDTDATTVAIHTEDRQIYSNLQNVDYCMHDEMAIRRSLERGKALPIFKWPLDFNSIQKRKCGNSNNIHEVISTSKRRKPNINAGWDFYYGDGISDADFREIYCSKKRKFEIDKSMESLPPATTNDDAAVDELGTVLHDLIQRSWDKAVHIACSTLSTLKNKNNVNSDGSHKNGTQNIVSDLSCQAAAVVKCKELEISFAHINIINNQYTCECCHKILRYVSNEEVIKHLFGDQNTRGCCWKAIEEKQRKIAMKILERETISIIDNLLQIMFKKIKRKCEDTQNEDNDENMGWKEVYEEMNCALRRSLKCQHDDKVYFPEGLATLQTDANLMPFPLNDHLLEIVLSRLTTRYLDDDNIEQN